MTVSSALNRKEYDGDGTTTAFSTSPVVFFTSADLDVYLVDADGVATLQTLTTHYTVSGGSGSTGTVTMVTAPTASPAQTLVIERVVDITQTTDLVNNDASDAEVIEDALDKLTMIAQQNANAIDRCLQLTTGDTTGGTLTVAPTPSTVTLVGFDENGDAGTFVPSDLDLTVTSAFVDTLLDDADAAAFLTTLGIPNPAELDVEDQALTGGVIVTSKSLGTVSSGTTTPDPGDRPQQHYTNNGAHTLAPSANGGSILLDITNGASAGAITTSGFTKVTGDAFTTTNGHKFRCHISIGNGGSLLAIQALQ